MTRAELLAWKRRQLLAESAAQRIELARQLRPVAYRLESVDSGLRIVAKVRRHPEWIAGAALAVALIRPRRLSSLFRSGVSALRMWRSLEPTLRALLARPR